MESGELLNNFPFIRRLVDLEESRSVELNKELYTQTVASVLVQAGKVAKAAGHGGSVGDSLGEPLGRADPNLMLVEIENLLRDALKLVFYAELLFFTQGRPHNNSLKPTA